MPIYAASFEFYFHAQRIKQSNPKVDIVLDVL